MYRYSNLLMTSPNAKSVSSWRAASCALALSGVFVTGLGYAVNQTELATTSGVRPLELPGEWIAADDTPGYAASFRRRIDLSGSVKHAWIAVAARDGFEVMVNRNPVGRHYLWRPTRPFQTGMSEKGQRLTPTTAAMAMNFPREYQWSDSGSTRLPVFLDITCQLRAGKNVLCVDVESRTAPAMLLLAGEIVLHSGEIVRIETNADWRAETTPPGLAELHWSEPNYDDSQWGYATRVSAPRTRQFSSFPPQIFSTPFDAEWLRHPRAASDAALWFETTWTLDASPADAWLRLLTNRPYDLFINDVRVRTRAGSMSSMDDGHWIVGGKNSSDPVAAPELLDPDESGSIFVGKRFESPRAPPSGATEEFLYDSARFGDPYSIVTAQADGNTSTRVRPWETGEAAELKLRAAPERLTPKALSRNFGESSFLAYDIARLVKRGDNRIAVRLSPPLTVDKPNWAAELSLDGGGRSTSGELFSFSPASDWTTRIDGQATSVRAAIHGSVAKQTKITRRLKYAGAADQPTNLCATVKQLALWAMCGLGIAFILMLLVFFASAGKANASVGFTAVGRAGRWVCGICIPSIAVFIAALLLRSAWVEREEILWFMTPQAWRVVIALALGSAWVTAIVTGVTRAGSRTAGSWTANVRRFFDSGPSTWGWRFLLFTILLLAAFLRLYQLDFQPLDDDEYASTQAVLSIAETGVPSFVPEGVWYTRSPLYHYASGAIVAVCGGNLWSLRAPSALLGVMTCWLVYLLGSRVLGRPWVGMGAMLLLAVHPFEVYTGHVARFYQAQQYFALLTIYCFCRGFVVRQSQTFRYLTVVVFLAAVLCQEITAALGVLLAIGYVLFARDFGWKRNSGLALVALLALSVIAIDYMVFQTRCLTRVEGVSPSIEAAIKPHFWNPYNLFAMFIGYSRLHLALSAMLLAGMPLVWKERHRPTFALHFMFLAGVVLMNLLVTHVSFRYQYWLIPLWVLLSLDSLRAVVQYVSRAAYSPLIDHGRNTWVPALTSVVCLACVVLSWSPWRMINSYQTKILGDSTGAMQYVRSNLQTDDKVMVTEPHTHAAYLEVGRADYDLSIPLLYDFVLLQDGKLIDRNAGAEAVPSIHKLMKVFRSDDRVWVLVNREKLRTRGKNIRWEYPGARVELFLRKNCELKHRTYLWSVYLWDAGAGKLKLFRSDGV